MLCFDAFEALGVRCARFSDKSDGDLARDASDNALQRFCKACALDLSDLVLLKQVHGSRVVVAVPPSRAKSGEPLELVEADALVTNELGVALGILAADCVPVYLFDPVKRAVGLAHAGRAGTMKGVAKNLVSAMRKYYGCAPEALYALIGPAAGPCCYQVSFDIANSCKISGLSVADRIVDLWVSNVEQLQSCGLHASRITKSSLCSICDGRFHSHRSDPASGRNLAILAL